MRVYLVGFMGAGKTAVGRALAQRLGWPFEDLDEAVVARAGRSIESIFAEEGEGRFRELEWHALAATGLRTPLVVATGGGLFLAARHREWIREMGVSVWLDCPLERIRERVGRGTGRPLWARPPLELRALFERRRAAYALADLHVDAGQGEPEAVAARVAERLHAFFR